MKLNGKTVKVKKRQEWRLDADYLDKLSPSDRAYYERFLAEYYDAVGLKDPNALHHTDELRKACYVDQNARYRDLVTAGDDQIQKASKPHSRGKPYSAADYPTADGTDSLEEEESFAE